MNLAARCLAVAVMPGMVIASSPAAAQQVAAEAAAQPWYPEGYLDLKLAAAEYVATFPREQQRLLTPDDGAGSYNLFNCDITTDLGGSFGGRHGALAVEIATKRAELARLGYRLEVYDQPLLDYERMALETIAEAREIEDRWLENPPAVEVPRTSGRDANGNPVTVSGPVAIPPPEVPRVGYEELASALEAARTNMQPDQPRFTVVEQCRTRMDEVLNIALVAIPARGPEDGFTFYMRPRNGALRLVNAFAFQVCQRKAADPWRDVSCGWRDYSDGEFTASPGRYMYEVRWPDGTVQRGAKVLERDARGKFTSHTFRRD